MFPRIGAQGIQRSLRRSGWSGSFKRWVLRPMSGGNGTQLRGWESREENDGFAFEGTLVIYVRAQEVLALADHFGVAHVRGANDID